MISLFDSSEADGYRSDLANAIIQILKAGHFALDTAADEIAMPIDEFIKES